MVSINPNRTAVVIQWDAETVGGDEVEIRCTNPDGGDVSTTTASNDGNGVVSFPEGYSGKVDVVVTGEKGEDTGSIEV